MLRPGAESVQVIYESIAHLQTIHYTHPSHGLSPALPTHDSCFSSSTKLLVPNAFEHLGDTNEHILTTLPWGVWILSPFAEDLPMAIQSVADPGRGPRNLVLQPSVLTTALFLCSLLWAGHLFAGGGPPNSYQMVINFYSHYRPELDLNQYLRGAKALCVARYWSLKLGISLVNGLLPTVNTSLGCQQSPKASITVYSAVCGFSREFIG